MNILVRTLRDERARDRISNELAKLDAYTRTHGDHDPGVTERAGNLRRGYERSQERVAELEDEVIRMGRLEDLSRPPRHVEAGVSYDVGVGPQERRGAAFDESQKQLERLHGEVAALRLEAEGEAQRAQEGLARIKRDYLSGQLDVTDWQELREELRGELEAASAQVEQLDAQAEAIAAELDAVDV